MIAGVTDRESLPVTPPPAVVFPVIEVSAAPVIRDPFLEVPMFSHAADPVRQASVLVARSLDSVGLVVVSVPPRSLSCTLLDLYW